MTQHQREALECEAGFVFQPMTHDRFIAQFGKNSRTAYWDEEHQGVWTPPDTMPLWQAAIVMAGVIGVGYLLHSLCEPKRETPMV